MSEETTYTIGALADAAGVTPRTIRYYTSEGLLPPPDTRGKYALYSEDHLLRLRLIARLKDAYLPLGEIRARLEPLTSAQVQQLLDEFADEPAPASASAADYVAQVLGNRTLTPQRLTETAGRYQVPSAAGMPRAQAPLGTAGGAAHEELRPAMLPGAPAPTPGRAEAEANAQPPATSGLLGRLLPRRRQQSERSVDSEAVEEHWRRITLAPGVELSVREPQPTALQEKIAQLLTRAREIFGYSGGQ